MKEKFIDKRFGSEALALIVTCNQILIEYEGMGYDLSLRQLYYQLVSRNVMPNSERSYKNLGNLVSDARLAGLIDWDMIRDRGRSRITNGHWETPADIIDSAASSFAIDKWIDQPTHIEVMVEKQALEGILLPVCQQLDIAFSSNKGYSSSSALYEAGKRLGRIARQDKKLVVLYLGDHDPSGIDMTRDVQERLTLFADQDVTVERLALNMNQVRELNPPENPAKITDSRANEYIRRFGRSSWELDAIEPRALATIVTNAVMGYRDSVLWDRAIDREEGMRDQLKTMATEYRREH